MGKTFHFSHFYSLSLGGVGSWRILSSMQRPSGPRHLVDVPLDYSTLINAAADFKCANNVVGECKHPVMCLSCGVILCSKVNTDLASHYKKCNSENGIILYAV